MERGARRPRWREGFAHAVDELRRIDSRLRSLKGRLEALPWYAERFGSGPTGSATSDANLEALRYELGDTLDRFDGAHAWYLADEMSDEQAERHRQNLALLATRVPAIRQLGLRLPSGDLLAALGSVAAARAEAEPA